MKRRLLKILKILGLAVAALAVVVALAAAWLVRRPWPQTGGELAVAGLSAPVEVIRDEWGVPHLYAANEHDLFFAQGYVHAQDRLWQMELNRHVSGGRLAELFGPPVVAADKSLRTFGLRRAAERDLGRLTPATRAILDAYAEGVNAYVDANRGRLPLEFTILGVDPKPWTPVDSIAWGKMIALSLGQNHFQEELRARLIGKLGAGRARQLMTPYPDGETVIVTPEEGGYGPGAPVVSGPAVHPILAAYLGSPVTARGSNNWVVHGSRTATGKPFLANDTHLWLNMPSEWYENGLHAGRFAVAGFSFPGVPMVLVGHNQRIAWGISNMCGDSQDLFVETLDDRRQVKVGEEGEEWRAATIVKETVNVKGGPPQSFEIVVTPHGAVINEADELKGMPPLALRWTLDEPGNLFDSLAGYNTARDWKLLPPGLVAVDSPHPQLRLRRRGRQHRLPGSRPDPRPRARPARARPRARRRSRPRLEGFPPLRADAEPLQPESRLHRYRQQQDRQGQLPPLDRLRLRRSLPRPPHFRASWRPTRG